MVIGSDDKNLVTNLLTWEAYTICYYAGYIPVAIIIPYTVVQIKC